MERETYWDWDLAFRVRSLSQAEFLRFFESLPTRLRVLAMMLWPVELWVGFFKAIPDDALYELAGCWPGLDGQSIRIDPDDWPALVNAFQAFLAREPAFDGFAAGLARAIDGKPTGWRVHARLRKDAPERYRAISGLRWHGMPAPICLADFERCNDKGIQNVLKELDYEELALALKGEPEEVQQLFLRNMSQRASELIREEMRYMGPVRKVDVAAAQGTVLDITRRLLESGDVIYRDPDNPDDAIIV